MSKRRISHQQSARIVKRQKQYCQQTAIPNNLSTQQGLVITRYSRHALIEDKNGTHIHCSIRPNLETIVAGDYIIWQPESMGEQGVIISLCPRQSVLGRPNKQGILKPIAANITQLMIVIAPKPQVSWPLLDSYLVIAEYLNLQACIILNKTDLPCDALKQQLIQEYKPLGYPLLFVSQKDKQSQVVLQDMLNHHISVFVGQSGVGKSSLIKQNLPLIYNIQTASISDGTDLGRHTTSNSNLYHLPTGGALIDSPGVREFGLWHMPATEIAQGYREFKPYLDQCKFRNCTHLQTPGCALFQAVKDGFVSRNRYNNYARISIQFAK